MALQTTKYVHIIPKQVANIGRVNIWPGKSLAYVSIIQDLSTANYHVFLFRMVGLYITASSTF
jgi:ribosomal protein S6